MLNIGVIKLLAALFKPGDPLGVMQQALFDSRYALCQIINAAILEDQLRGRGRRGGR